MIKNLRLAIIDYPKNIIHNKTALSMFTDMIKEKQLSYERTDINYVPFSNLDMISTHFFIYDTTDIYSPTQILSMRMTFENRCLKHKISLPYLSYLDILAPEIKHQISDFKKNYNLVDAGSMSVHPDWSFKKTGIPLIEIGYFMLFSHLIKTGQSNMMATTNEKFKASRTLYAVGDFCKDNHFIHPIVQDPHLLILMENINSNWLKNSLDKYVHLYENRIEITPSDSGKNEILLDDKSLFALINSLSNGTQVPFREIGLKPRESVAS